MTKTEAIREARRRETENVTMVGNEHHEAYMPAGVEKKYWLRNRRIVTALVLAGYGAQWAREYAEICGHGSFRELVYEA